MQTETLSAVDRKIRNYSREELKAIKDHASNQIYRRMKTILACNSGDHLKDLQASKVVLGMALVYGWTHNKVQLPEKTENRFMPETYQALHRLEVLFNLSNKLSNAWLGRKIYE